MFQRRPALLPTPPASTHLHHGAASTLQRYQGGFSDYKPICLNDYSEPTTSTDDSVSAPTRDLIPKEFFHVTKNHFTVIKCFHHLSCLQTDTPASLLKTAKVLRQQLRPAFITDDFKSKAEAIALSWVAESTSAMKEHYEKILNEVTDNLRDQAIPADLLVPSHEIATKWAKNQLQRKLRDRTLEAALTRIVLHQRTYQRCPEPLSSAPKTSVSPSVLNKSTQFDNWPAASAPVSVSTQTDPLSATPLPPRAASAQETDRSLDATAIVTSSQLLAAAAGPSVDLDVDTSPRPPAPQQDPLSQLDLFGSIVDDRSQSERQPNQPLPEANARNCRVVLGDDNLRNFSHHETIVISRPKAIAASSQPLAAAAGPSVDLDEDASLHPPAPQQGPLSQLDLFGSIVDDRSQSERQPNQPLPEANAWNCRVVLGDDNLRNFSHHETTVISRPKGRLSHFHRLFSKLEHGPISNVNTLIICLSTLDKRNTHSTNISSLKSLLGTAKKVFPCAKIFILACGIDNAFSIEERLSCSSINNFIRNKAPSSSVHIPTVDPFSCHDDAWDSDTKARIYTLLSSYLN